MYIKNCICKKLFIFILHHFNIFKLAKLAATSESTKSCTLNHLPVPSLESPYLAILIPSLLAASLEAALSLLYRLSTP